MKRLLVSCIILLITVTSVNGTDVVSKSVRFEITKVQLDKKAFTPSKGEKVSLLFEITKEADVKVMIYDELGNLVRQFEMLSVLFGRHNIKWDGYDTKHNLAAGRMFLYVIEAIDKSGNKIVYNPSDYTGGIMEEAKDYGFDKDSGKIEYVLPKTCMVRFRAGLKDSAFIKTILDWQPQTAGRHTLIWDGKDSTGLMNIGKRPDLELGLTCYSLPANTILVENDYIPFKSAVCDSPKNDIWHKHGKYMHYTHDLRNCHEPRFFVSFPQSKTQKDIPVLSGIVPLRVEIAPEDIQYMVSKRFEIVFYVDGVFLFEIEEGTSPFTCHLDTKGFAKGEHILTVNMISYDDHIGVLNKQIIIGANNHRR